MPLADVAPAAAPAVEGAPRTGAVTDVALARHRYSGRPTRCCQKKTLLRRSDRLAAALADVPAFKSTPRIRDEGALGIPAADLLATGCPWFGRPIRRCCWNMTFLHRSDRPAGAFAAVPASESAPRSRMVPAVSGNPAADLLATGSCWPHHTGTPAVHLAVVLVAAASTLPTDHTAPNSRSTGCSCSDCCSCR